MPVLYGGKPIASGGFGCIFYPALSCNNEKGKKGYVSKLMLKDKANEEYYISKMIYDELKNIKQFKKYYSIDNQEPCTPTIISTKDLVNFNEECNNLLKYDINKSNINSNLDKLSIINMPYEGKDYDKWIRIKYKKINMKHMIRFHNEIIHCIKKAIIPMNNNTIYHMDIKDSNLMYKNNRFKIIDWGLAAKMEKNSNKIPTIIKSRPLQFNLPYSVLLLNDSFDTFLLKYVERIQNKTIDNINFYNIGREYYNYFISKNSNGHIKFLTHIYDIIHPGANKDLVQKKVLNIIVIYITNVLREYIKIKNDKIMFDKMNFVKNIYLHNADIFGLLTVLYNYFELNVFSNIKNKRIRYNYKNAMINIVDEYLFSPKFAIKKIQLDELENKFKKINSILSTKVKKTHRTHSKTSKHKKTVRSY